MKQIKVSLYTREPISRQYRKVRRGWRIAACMSMMLRRTTSPPRYKLGMPNRITFSSDGRYGAVSKSGSDYSSIIDTSLRQEVARVKVGNPQASARGDGTMKNHWLFLT
jgi:hypothetical protein